MTIGAGRAYEAYRPAKKGGDMPKRKTSKRPRRSDSAEPISAPVFRPYVRLIGQVCLAWNELHEVLGQLFREVLGDDMNDKFTSVWQSAQTDRAKRAMLEGAVRALTVAEARQHPRAEDDIVWLLRRVDTLEEDRNNVVHAPLEYRSSIVSAILGWEPGIQPDHLWGNRRAIKLKEKDLLTEYRYCRNAIGTLRDYAEVIHDAWTPGRKPKPWPERPLMPNRGQKKSSRASTEKQEDTQIPLPLKTS